MDVETALLLFAVAWAVTEGSILYFVLRLRANSKRLEQEFIPNQIAQVKALFNEIDWSKAGEAAWGRIEAALEGMAGAAAKQGDKMAGAEVLTQLAAIDLGHPLLNGLWQISLKAEGPKIVTRLGRIARRIPIVGGFLEEESSQYQEGGQNFQR